MATYAQFKHVELHKIGYGKNRVPNAPRGCISEIFSGDQADGVVAAALRNGSNGKPRLVRETPVKPRDTHSRLFGGQVAAPLPAPQVTDTIRSNIKFEEGAMMNGKGAAVNGNGVASPAKSPVLNGVGAMNGSAGSSAVSTPSKVSYQPARRNPVTGDGVFLPPRPRRWATARAREGNPITGDGYKSMNGEINTAVTALNGNFMPINHNRIPPGGFSTGLW